MFKCRICKSKEFHIASLNKVFQIEGEFYPVKNIPVTVCSHCGEEIFTRETTERIRAVLQVVKET